MGRTFQYPPPCRDGKGNLHSVAAEGDLLAPNGQRTGVMCRACAETVIAEYRDKLGQVWRFEPFEPLYRVETYGKDFLRPRGFQIVCNPTGEVKDRFPFNCDDPESIRSAQRQANIYAGING